MLRLVFVKLPNGKCEEFVAGPLEPGGEAVLPRFGQLPGEEGPRYAMYREAVLVEVEERRRRIKRHLPACGAVAVTREAVRPRMEEWDPGGAPLRGHSLEIFYASEDLRAPVAKRGPDHPVAGQEDSLEIARDDGVSG